MRLPRSKEHVKTLEFDVDCAERAAIGLPPSLRYPREVETIVSSYILSWNAVGGWLGPQAGRHRCQTRSQSFFFSPFRLGPNTMWTFAALVALCVVFRVFALPNPRSALVSASSTTSLPKRVTQLCVVGLTAYLQAIVLNHLYTNGRTMYNTFVPPSLPGGYFAHGDVDTSCTQIHMDGLMFCEDAKLWHTTDANGRVLKRVIATCDRHRFVRPIPVRLLR
jgi:hypothetical protein